MERLSDARQHLVSTRRRVKQVYKGFRTGVTRRVVDSCSLNGETLALDARHELTRWSTRERQRQQRRIVCCHLVHDHLPVHGLMSDSPSAAMGHALACPSDKQIYVAETSNWRVQKLILK